MVGYLVVEPVSNKPKVVQPLGQDLHQLALASDVVPEQQEHQLEDHLGIHRHVAVGPLLFLHFAADQREVHDLRHPAKRMVLANPIVQVNRIAEEALLILVLAHHCERRLAHPKSRIQI